MFKTATKVYPIYYPILAELIILISIFLAPLISYLLSKIILSIQINYYASNCSIYFQSYYYIFVAIFFLPVLGLIILSLTSFLEKFAPEFYKYTFVYFSISPENRETWNFRKMNNRVLKLINEIDEFNFQKQLNSLKESNHQLTNLAIAISIPISLLIFSNYYEFNCTGFRSNKFITITESYYNYSDINAVNIEPFRTKDRADMIILTNDNKRHKIQVEGTDKKNIILQLEKQNIPLKYIYK